MLQSGNDDWKGSSTDPPTVHSKLHDRFVYHARRPHAEPLPHVESNNPVEDHFHVYPFVFRNLAKRNRSQLNTVRQTVNGMDSPPTSEPPSSPTSATPSGQPQQNSSISDTNTINPSASPNPSSTGSPTPESSDAKHNNTAEAATSTPISKGSPEQSDQNQTSQPTESSPPHKSSPNNNDTNPANVTTPKSATDPTKENDESSSDNQSLSPKLFKSRSFLIGAGIIVIVALAAAYFSFTSGICSGRRRSGAGQPYEIVDQDDISGRQSSNVNVSGQASDANGWNDGWDNDDWETNDGRSKD